MLLNVLPKSHLFLPISALPISHLLLPPNLLPISHLLLFLLDVLPISHPNLFLLLQLPYPKTPRKGSKSRWSKTKRKRKRSILHPTRTPQTRKGQCTAWQRQIKEEEEKKCDQGMRIGKSREDFDEKVMHFRGRGTRQSWSWLNTLWHISNGYRNEHLEITVTERNRCTTQKRRNFETT